MMKRKYQSKEAAMAIAKSAIWLAWNACGGTSGMGFLKDNKGANKEQVWDQAYNKKDYSGERGGGPENVDADYVFGRMMKLRFTVEGDTITFDDYDPQKDYQSWCGKYTTFASLFDDAEAVLTKTQAA